MQEGNKIYLLDATTTDSQSDNDDDDYALDYEQNSSQTNTQNSVAKKLLRFVCLFIYSFYATNDAFYDTNVFFIFKKERLNVLDVEIMV